MTNEPEEDGGPMSARNNKKFLVGFGVIAAVLVVVLALWRPQVPNEPVSGAIGAVQKHHAAQIAKADVILVDEPTRQQQKFLYSDPFTDSVKLQNVALELGSAARGEAGSAALLQKAQSELQEMSADVQSRYLAGMKSALASIEQLSAKQNLSGNRIGSVSEEAEQLSSALASNHQLSSEEMGQLAARLSAISKGLQSRDEAFSLNVANRDLASAVTAMQNKSELASAKLESVASALNANANLNSISLAAYARSMESMAVEAKILGEVEMQLASRNAGAAEQGSAVRELASEAAALESNALKNVEMQMESQSHMASALHDMEMQLASAQQAGSNAQMGSVQQALASRQAEFQARAAGSVSAALSSFSAYMNSRSEMAARSESRAEVQAAVMGSNTLNARINAKAELAQRLASAATLQSNLASIQKNLESNSALGSMLSSAPQLAAETQALEMRATALQSNAH